MIKAILRTCMVIMSILTFSDSTFSQNDSVPLNFRTVISVTNNGMSLIPTFSLGKPAIVFDASFGRRLTFDPMIRYSLEGKPWSFILWWRYKMLKPGKFQFTLGAHPSIMFREIPVTTDGVSSTIIRARQYAVVELYPYYNISKNISAGFYYNYSRALQKDDTRVLHFLTARMIFSNMNLFKGVTLSAVPQVYYLKMDSRDGFYATSAFTLAKRDFPVSVSSVINRKIRSEIVSDKFVWNVSLNFTLNKRYQQVPAL